MASELLNLISGTAGAIATLVVFLSLLLLDKLHTDAEFLRLAAALDREKAAHDETRKALALASERADAAVHATEMVADALTEARASRARARQPAGGGRRRGGTGA